MAAALRSRLRVRVSAAAGAGLLGLLAGSLAGCATPGELRDNGVTGRVTPPPVPQPLWSDLAAAPPPVSPTADGSRATDPPPQPIPDVTVPGQDITVLDARTVLAKDPGVTAEERRALDGCPACEVRSAEHRDLTGDGRDELFTAVGTGELVVLHVYTVAGDRVVPVLRVQVQKGFSAETIGPELWLYEPTTVYVRTSSHYRWDGVRLALVERKVEGIGPIPGSGQGSPAETGAVPAPPTATPTVMPGASRPAPGAVAPSRPSAPGNGAGAGDASARPAFPSPAAPSPVRPTPAAPEAKP
ncbi:hypothetical protein ACGFZP_39315 [Kitasatospora sp. NPDC048239]|uniref:hypothetical protein n=1 Tax=Kitasatospora sp. NPDC048239 TaxID=3364046 RepID=UPI003716CE8A